MSGPTYYKKKQDNMKSSKIVDEINEGLVGQGELYSPNHAIKIDPNDQPRSKQINNDDNTNNNNTPNHLKEKIHHHHHHHQNQELSKGNNMVGKGVANDIKNKMHMIKERLMEKLTAASVPSDALENARHYVESVIKDVTSAAQGITMEALLRIKSHLADILPSLSPSLTSKMVDDAEEEATTKKKKKKKIGAWIKKTINRTKEKLMQFLHLRYF